MTASTSEPTAPVTGGASTKRPPLPRRVASLTSLRFFAAMAVFVHHFSGIGGRTGTGRAPLIYPETRLGVHGVTFFFVLSGFVLTWAFKPGEHVGSYYWRRVGRLWPAHLVASALALAVILDNPRTALEPLSFIWSLLLVQAWIPNVTPTLPGNGVTWTLSVELLFYALFPLLVRLVRRTPLRTLVPVALAGQVAMYLFAWWAYTHLSPKHAGFALRHPIFYLPEFILGMVAATYILRGHRLRVHPAAPIAVLAFYSWLVFAHGRFMSASWRMQFEYAVRPVVALMSMVIIVAFVQREVAGRRGILQTPMLIALGAWSYSFYLLHQPIRHLLVVHFGRVPNTNMALFTLLGVAVVVQAMSWALYTFVEHPAERWMSRHVPRRWRRPAAQSHTQASSKPETA